jgi:hypothetical protein
MFPLVVGLESNSGTGPGHDAKYFDTNGYRLLAISFVARE